MHLKKNRKDRDFNEIPLECIPSWFTFFCGLLWSSSTEYTERKVLFLIFFRLSLDPMRFLDSFHSAEKSISFSLSWWSEFLGSMRIPLPPILIGSLTKLFNCSYLLFWGTIELNTFCFVFFFLNKINKKYSKLFLIWRTICYGCN